VLDCVKIFTRLTMPIDQMLMQAHHHDRMVQLQEVCVCVCD
jgi:hypothetical protein